MADEKNQKDFDLPSLDDEPDLKTKEPAPDIKKRRRIVLWIAGVCGVIVIIALVIVVAMVALKDEPSTDGSETQGGRQRAGGVTSQTHEWSQWGGCSVSCGMGRRTRVRNLCPPSTTGCDKEDSRTCRYSPCPS